VAKATRDATLTSPAPEVRRAGLVSPALLLRLKRHGIIYPLQTVRAQRAAKLGLPLACALLVMETGGGHNEFGHDMFGSQPAPGYGWGTVTKTKYLAFRYLRDIEHRSNGVGPGQLTSISLQDEADRIGGCWVPQHNMAVGFHYLHDLILEHGLHGGCVAYNGSGPAAQRYADHLLALAEHFKAAHCGSLIGIIR
jgi:hypothetical protein